MTEAAVNKAGGYAGNHAVDVRQLTAAVGAEIRGADLAHVTDAQFAAIERAWIDCSALLFRGQHLGHDALLEFSRRFGELDPPPVNENGKKFVEGYPDIYVVSNIIGVDGTPIGSLGAGEAVWHTDMSYLPEPPDASLLYAVEIPPAGGDTWLCGMIAACASLPQALRAAVKGRSIKHDGTYNSGGYLRAGLADSSDPVNSVGTPHPIICVHPPSGKHTLYLGRRRNAYVVGIPLDESEALLDQLWAHAARPEHAYAHRWQIGDVLMWDNRTTMHRRDPFDSTARRLMYRTQIKGKATPLRAL
jgi:taurine dioxygenase